MKLTELLARTKHVSEEKPHGCKLVWINCAWGPDRRDYWALSDYFVSSQTAVLLWLVPKPN